MKEPITITIPGTVDLNLGPNRKPHPMKLNRLRNELKDRAWLSTLAVMPAPVTLPLALDVLVAWESKRRKRWDDDNIRAALKAAQDGIAAAIGIDDRDMRVVSVTQVYDDEHRGYIKVALREDDEA